uniref:CW-type domain-containing protein n=1 Tax=Syphacia muris TaxID=451379 RepID=A0A0N5AXK9_9BILA
MKTSQQDFHDGLGTSNADSDDSACSFVLEVLKCPLCSRQLVPMELDIITVEDEKYQRIWWTCSGLRTQSCEFPTSLPENVFWTQRSMKDMKNGFFPLPNLHLLPPEYRHLYPKLFDIGNGSINKSFMHCIEGQLLGPVHSNERPIRKCRRNLIGQHKKQRFSRGAARSLNKQGNLSSLDVVNVDDKISRNRCFTGVKEDESCDVSRLKEANISQFAESDEHSRPEECYCISESSMTASPKNNANDDDDSVVTLSTVNHPKEGTNTIENLSNAVAVESNLINDENTGVMSRISRKHMDLLSKRKVSLAEKKAAFEKELNRNEFDSYDLGKPKDSWKFNLCKEEGYVDNSLCTEEVTAGKEPFDESFDYFDILRKVKEPLDEGVPRRGLILRGAATPFRPEHFPSSIIDPLNWYRKVHLSGRTALDGFMAWYNLRYNRREYLDALAAEMCKRGVMKYIPSIPIKQQRIVKQLREELYGRKPVDIEALKKSFDSTALRLQMAHRLGIANVEPVVEKAKETTETCKEAQEDDMIQMWPLNSVPVVTNSLHSAETNQNVDALSIVESSDKLNVVSAEENIDEVKTTNFSNLPLSEGSASIISEYLSTGNCEVDKILHQKAVEQMQQVVNETNIMKRRHVETESNEQDCYANKEPIHQKQRRSSEVS